MTTARERAIENWTNTLQEAIDKIKQAQEPGDKKMLEAAGLIADALTLMIAFMAITRITDNRKAGEAFIKKAFGLLAEMTLNVYDEVKAHKQAYMN